MLILSNKRFVKKALVDINGPVGRGYGIFETMRTFNKKIFQKEEHLKRLFSSAQKIEMEIKYSKKEISKMLDLIVKKSIFKNQRVKITVIPQTVIITSQQLKIDQKIYEKGVSCKSIIIQRGLPEVKSISYLPSFLSHEKAVKEGYFEAILIDKNQETYEAAYHNIFWFENDILCTRSKDVLPGTIADLITKISPFKIKYKNIKIQKLFKKEEIFITNSLDLVVPVTKIDQNKISKGKPGVKTKLIMEKLSELIFVFSK